jgi:hypothetical protein
VIPDEAWLEPVDLVDDTFWHSALSWISDGL